MAELLKAAAAAKSDVTWLRDAVVHLQSSADWLCRSIDNGKGGSCAYYAPLRGWSDPYPETTGYIVPTLLALADCFEEARYRSYAESAGAWLCNIQTADGAWYGGTHPPRNPAPSVFNTGQIIKGLTILGRATGEPRFIDAARRGAQWLAARVGADGLWPAADYRAKETPSYYSNVAWPMLEVWRDTADGSVRDAARQVLHAIARRRADNGVVSGWGFEDDGPAFTHTIAYTIRGFQEAARLLDEPELAEVVDPALERLWRKSELANGRLAGAFDESWNATGNYVCLTGNCQVALCLLLKEAPEPDLRLVNGAVKLVDFVSATLPKAGARSGAVAGSAPIWGRYMRLRYPNWAAKYYCDALMRLMTRIGREEIQHASGGYSWV